MGSKQEKLLAEMKTQLAAIQNQYNQNLQAVNTEDPYTAAIGSDALATLNAAKSGDYSTLPKGIFYNYVDPAVRKRQRELSMNAGGQGISAMGTPNATLLGLNKQNLDDEYDRDDAANRQSQISGAISNAAGVAGGLGSQELQKKMSILDMSNSQLGNAQGSYNSYAAQVANQPSAWSQFLGGLAGTAANIGMSYATGGLSSLFKPKAVGHISATGAHG